MVLRAKPDVVLPEFLPFFMQSEMFFERAMSISVGSLSPTINWSALAKQEFPLPPLDEQRRIAEVLWAADETIQAYEDASEKLSVLTSVFIESTVAQTNGSVKWENVSLGDVLLKTQYGLASSCPRNHFFSIGRPRSADA